MEKNALFRMRSLCALGILLTLNIAGVLAQQSTTGPAPPKGLFMGYTYAAESQRLIAGVPAYLWTHGCGPTAAGMVVGYWDGRGYSYLVEGDASQQNEDVNRMIASNWHYVDYSCPLDEPPNLLPDKSSLGGAHESDCVADFMNTSWSSWSNYYGRSWFVDVPGALAYYARHVNSRYLVLTNNYFYFDDGWNRFKQEIDNQHPVVLLVDTDGNGGTDHFVTGIGYDDDLMRYCALNTWDHDIHWFDWQSLGNPWGVYGFTTFHIDEQSSIVNGGFESGTEPWKFYSDGAGTYSNDAPGFYSTHAGKVAVAAGGTNIQLYQSGVSLEPGARYRLMFRAYSTKGHDLSISIHKHTHPYTSYGLANYFVNLTNAWQQFDISFVATGFTGHADDGRLRFWFAGYSAPGDFYYFDDVMLEKVQEGIPQITEHPRTITVWEGQTATFAVVASGSLPLAYQWQEDTVDIPGATSPIYTITSVTTADHGKHYRCVVSNPSGAVCSNTAVLNVTRPPNIVRNPYFDYGPIEWSFHTNGAGWFTTDDHTPGVPYDHCAQVSISREGTNVQLLQTGIPLEPNTTYRLDFSAYSTTGHNMAVYLHRNSSPYTCYGLNNWVIDLTGEWRSFSKTFRTTGFTSPTTDTRLRFWFAPYDAAGDTFCVDDVYLSKGTVGKEAIQPGGPTAFALHQNYPNPFNPLTAITYELPTDCHVALKVYDILGREIATLVDEVQGAGYKAVEWGPSTSSGHVLASGVYFYRLKAGDFTSVKKMIITK